MVEGERVLERLGGVEAVHEDEEQAMSDDVCGPATDSELVSYV